MVNKLFFLASAFILGSIVANGQQAVEGHPEDENITTYQPRFGRKRPVIAVVAMNEGTEITDFIVPYGVLARSGTADVISLSTSIGQVKIEPFIFQLQSTLTEFDKTYPQGADYVVIPAVHGGDDSALVNWVASQAAKGSSIVSICLGATIVAKTGLMDGKRATSYFGNEKQRVNQFPQVKWQKNIRYVADGKIISSAGISASIPISLALIEAIAGKKKATTLAKELGILEWSPIHNSEIFQQPDVWANQGQTLNNSKENIGIPVKHGDDELSLALTAETYRFTGIAVPYPVIESKEAVKLANGLILLPTKVPEIKRMLSPLSAKHSIATLDSSLKEIEKIYGRRAAYNAAKRMEYPGMKNFQPITE
jgi:putative intracellular protease/amidase